MTITDLKKQLGLTNADIAGFFGLSPAAYANSSAKKRYEQALIGFYQRIIQGNKEDHWSGLFEFFSELRGRNEEVIDYTIRADQRELPKMRGDFSGPEFEIRGYEVNLYITNKNKSK